MNHAVRHRTILVSGFTLIEIVIVIAIAAVLATLAAPSFREYLFNQKIRNASFDLIASLAFARSEAITRNAEVDIVPASTDNWANGWTVRVGATDLRTQSAYQGLSITDLATPAKLTYGNDGRPSTAFTATIALPSPLSGVTSRCVTIGLSGVARSTVGGC